MSKSVCISNKRKLDRIKNMAIYKKKYIAKPCEICGWIIDPLLSNGRSNGLDTHHVIPVAVGGTDDEDNLIILCPNHHSTIHALWIIDSTCGYWGGPKTKTELIKVLSLIDSDPMAYYKSIQLTDADIFND